jgi:mono/diheme cytochrome c family protein
MHSKATIALVLSILTAASTALAVPSDATIRFNRDIRPIFTENCFACHGPDPGGRKEGLRFDRAEGFFTERKDGTPVVKGDPQKSLLYQQITSADSDEIMPRSRRTKP